jgi:hypothetical protein
MFPSTRYSKQNFLSLYRRPLAKPPLNTPLRKLNLATWDDTVVALIEGDFLVVGPTSGANIKAKNITCQEMILKRTKRNCKNDTTCKGLEPSTFAWKLLC